MKNTIIVLMFSLLFFACESGSFYSNEDLKGTWHAYTINTNGDIQDVEKGRVNFKFNENDYAYKGGAYQEAGTWKINGNLIETQVEGQLEKQVEIVKLENDTLIIKMNDNGIPMSMSFVKE